MTTTITLAGDEIPLTPPASPSLALALVRLGRSSPEWAGGAALVACQPHLAKKAGVQLDRSDLVATGQAMYDWLVARLVRHGTPGREAIGEAMRACGVALDVVMQGLPLESEVAADVGNSEPTPSS